VNVGSGVVVNVGSGMVVKDSSGVVVKVESGVVVNIGSSMGAMADSGAVVAKPTAPTDSLGFMVAVEVVSGGLPPGSPIKKTATTMISSAGRVIRVKPVRTCRCHAGRRVDTGGAGAELAVMDGGLAASARLYSGFGTAAPASDDGPDASGGVRFTSVGWL
jgi:hypothetical protein